MIPPKILVIWFLLSQNIQIAHLAVNTAHFSSKYRLKNAVTHKIAPEMQSFGVLGLIYLAICRIKVYAIDVES